MTVATHIASRLAEIIGAKHVVQAEEELATYAIDGLAPRAIARPSSADEVAEIVRLALADKLVVVPLGSRSKMDLGMTPERYDVALDMTGLHNIAHFDAGDLTLCVDAGIPLREVDGVLKEKGQFLPLAVPCFESATAGGSIAAGIDSALRLRYGSARDFLIGAEFVDGTGHICKSGGRVVKNVTGYDLHKLLIGSLGTLGAITRLNFRTFPLPEVTGGHLAWFGSSQAAVQYRGALEQAGLPLVNVEVLSPAIATILKAILERSENAFPGELERPEWFVYSAFEGNEAVVRRIGEELQSTVAESEARHGRLLERSEDESLGGMLRESFEWLRWASPANTVCRLALPEISNETLKALSQSGDSSGLRSGMLVRGAGIVYFAVFADEENETALAALTQIVSVASAVAAAAKGSATVLHAPPAVKVRGAKREQMDRALQTRVKQAFDPSNVFVAGRVVGGI